MNNHSPLKRFPPKNGGFSTTTNGYTWQCKQSWEIPHSPIPNLDNVECIECKAHTNALVLKLAQAIIKWFDLQNKVVMGTTKSCCSTRLSWSGIRKWGKLAPRLSYTQGLLPINWKLPPCLLKIQWTSQLPSPLNKFVHKLFLHTTGRDYHVQVLMGSEEDLETIIQTIRWWLKSTSKGILADRSSIGGRNHMCGMAAILCWWLH